MKTAFAWIQVGGLGLLILLLVFLLGASDTVRLGVAIIMLATTLVFLLSMIAEWFYDRGKSRGRRRGAMTKEHDDIMEALDIIYTLFEKVQTPEEYETLVKRLKELIDAN